MRDLYEYVVLESAAGVSSSCGADSTRGPRLASLSYPLPLFKQITTLQGSCLTPGHSYGTLSTWIYQVSGRKGDWCYLVVYQAKQLDVKSSGRNHPVDKVYEGGGPGQPDELDHEGVRKKERLGTHSYYCVSG